MLQIATCHDCGKIIPRDRYGGFSERCADCIILDMRAKEEEKVLGRFWETPMGDLYEIEWMGNVSHPWFQIYPDDDDSVPVFGAATMDECEDWLHNVVGAVNAPEYDDPVIFPARTEQLQSCIRFHGRKKDITKLGPYPSVNKEVDNGK